MAEAIIKLAIMTTTVDADEEVKDDLSIKPPPWLGKYILTLSTTNLIQFTIKLAGVDNKGRTANLVGYAIIKHIIRWLVL